MGILTSEMKEAVPLIRLAFVATVSPDGKPNLSAEGSLCVWDDDHLLFPDIASPQTMKNLESNPHVEINTVDQIGRRGFRFKGVAEVYPEGEVFAGAAAAVPRPPKDSRGRDDRARGRRGAGMSRPLSG
jgi:predicted pyridoxine 5'-phosphate oxidase superfamily flavin-nucleotide-binding protein